MGVGSRWSMETRPICSIDLVKQYISVIVQYRQGQPRPEWDERMAASIITKVTLTMALTLVGVRLARKSRAAVRHLLLAAGFAVLLALPMASIAVPSVPLIEVPIVMGSIAQSPAVPS